MSLILCLETSSVNCSVALFENRRILASIEEASGYSHAENLHPFIAKVMKEAGKEIKDLDAIMVGAGPGSFTGLRIGVATAKGFCYGLDIPLMSLSSLQNMSIGIMNKYAQDFEDAVRLRPLVDARRMEVYTAAFDGSVEIQQEAEARILDEHSFDEELSKHTVFFFGDGMAKMREWNEQNANARFIEGVYPSALNMQEIAFEKFESQDFEDVAYYEPFYLKGFHATTPKKLI